MLRELIRYRFLHADGRVLESSPSASAACCAPLVGDWIPISDDEIVLVTAYHGGLTYDVIAHPNTSEIVEALASIDTMDLAIRTAAAIARRATVPPPEIVIASAAEVPAVRPLVALANPWLLSLTAEEAGGAPYLGRFGRVLLCIPEALDLVPEAPALVEGDPPIPEVFAPHPDTGASLVLRRLRVHRRLARHGGVPVWLYSTTAYTPPPRQAPRLGS